MTVFEILSRYEPVLVDAFIVTVELSVAGFLGGLALGIVVGALRLLVGPAANLLISGAVDFLRGTPLLVQLMGWYLGTSALGFGLPPLGAAIVGLAVYAGAFISEIVRGGLEAVPRPQWEAGLSIGLSRVYTIRRILLPQALPSIVPALVGFYIGMIKDTSLAFTIGVAELTRAAKIIADREFRPLEAFFAVGILYFAICFPLARLVTILDRRSLRSGIVQDRIGL